jgi:YVTN family beta-propeller protein
VNFGRRRCLAVALLLCGLLVAIGRSQYVEDSIEVPGGWVGTLTYNSKADVVYGTSEMANAVFAIYCPTNIMFRRLAANDARCVVYDSIDNKAYASCGFNGAESIEVVDGANHILLGGFSLLGANVLVWEPTRNRLYVTCTNQNRVAVVDCTSDSVIAQISVGAAPIKLHLNTRRDKLYVQNYDGGSLSIIDLATNHVTRALQLGGNPNAGYYAPHVDKYYCANRRADDAIAVIDGLSDSIVARVPIMFGGAVDAIGGSDANDLVMAEAYNGPTQVYAIDARADTLLSTLDVSSVIYSIACGPATGYLYCANADADNVFVVDPIRASVVETLPVGDAPYVLLSVPMHGRMYLGHLNSDMVYVIRDSSTGVAESDGEERLARPRLVASPNPFTASTALTLASVETLASTVVICNSYGREVRRLGSNRRTHRECGVVWDGADQTGSPVPAGVYVARLVGRPEMGTKLVRVAR